MTQAPNSSPNIVLVAWTAINNGGGGSWETLRVHGLSIVHLAVTLAFETTCWNKLTVVAVEQLTYAHHSMNQCYYVLDVGYIKNVSGVGVL